MGIAKLSPSAQPDLRCPSCSGPDIRCLGLVSRNAAFACRACGLAFMDPATVRGYAHEEWYDWLQCTPEYAQRSVRLYGPAMRRRLAQISNFAPGRALVEIGAGDGTFCRVAADAGWQVTCVDVNERAREFGTKLFGLNYRNLEQLEPASADVVYMSHVLEHIPQPLDFLAVVRKVLRPNGVCLPIVPHYQPLTCVLKNLVLTLVPGRHDFRGHIYSPQHVLGFTRASLRALLHNSGFRPLRVFCVSRGNPAYYPWKSPDGPIGAKQALFEAINNVGNFLGCGSWIVGYFTPDGGYPATAKLCR